MKKVENNINKILLDGVCPVLLKNTKYLDVIFDARKSFYKKAYSGTWRDALYLVSYSTVVACVYKNQLRIYGYFSPTTARHIREFAKQNGFFDDIKCQDMKDTAVFEK